MTQVKNPDHDRSPALGRDSKDQGRSHTGCRESRGPDSGEFQKLYFTLNFSLFYSFKTSLKDKH